MDTLESQEFDAKAYIEKEYKHATLFELGESLISIKNELKKNETESKNLVSRHFDKFIECRTVLEAILTHLEDNLEIKKLRPVNMKSLNSLSIPQYGSIKRREEIKRDFKHLFELSHNLEKAENHEDFLFYTKCAFGDLQRASSSKYLRSLWNESSNLRIDFLTKMCDEIEKNTYNFSEMFQYFDFYFEIEKMHNTQRQYDENALESPTVQEYKQKIENTIFVNAKVSMLKVFENEDLVSAVEETKYGFTKLLESEISSVMKKEVLNVYMGLFICFVKKNKVDMMMYDFLISECQSLISLLGPKIDINVKYIFINKKNELINEIVQRIIFSSIDAKLNTIEWGANLLKNIKIGMKIGKDCEKEFLKKTINDVLHNRISSNKLIEEVRYIKETLLDEIGDVLKADISEMKIFYDEFQELEEVEIEKIIKEYETELIKIKKIKDGPEDIRVRNEKLLCQTMMLIFKIIDDYPRSYVKIINRISDKIENNAVFYYIKDIYYSHNLVLNDSERFLIEKYKKMFGFLINNDEIEDDNEKKTIVLREESDELIEKNGELRIDKKTIKSSSSRVSNITKDDDSNH